MPETYSEDNAEKPDLFIGALIAARLQKEGNINFLPGDEKYVQQFNEKDAEMLRKIEQLAPEDKPEEEWPLLEQADYDKWWKYEYTRPRFKQEQGKEESAERARDDFYNHIQNRMQAAILLNSKRKRMLETKRIQHAYAVESSMGVIIG